MSGIGPITGGSVEIAYAETTTGVTVTSTSGGAPDLIVQGPTVVLDGVTRVKVEAWCGGMGYPATGWMAPIFGDGVAFSGIAYYSGAGAVPFYATHTYIPSAGSHSFSLYAYLQNSGSSYWAAGNGTGGASCPIFMRVSRA